MLEHLIHHNAGEHREWNAQIDPTAIDRFELVEYAEAHCKTAEVQHVPKCYARRTQAKRRATQANVAVTGNERSPNADEPEVKANV